MEDIEQATSLNETPTLTARGVVDKRISDKTKSQYKLYYKKFSNWLEEKYPGEYRLEGGSNDVDFSNIPVTIYEEAFGHFQYTDKGDGKTFVSKSMMDNYRKAIVFYHKEQGQHEVLQAANIFFKNYVKGFSNVIATERHEGRMQPREGKDVMTGTILLSLRQIYETQNILYIL